MPIPTAESYTRGLLPGVQIGLAVGESARRNKIQQRELAQRDADLAQRIQFQNAELALRTGGQKIQEAQVMHAWGVPPVIGEDGQIDYMKTQENALAKQESDKEWASLGAARAWQSKDGQMSSVDYINSLVNPAFATGFNSQSAARSKVETEAAARLEQAKIRRGVLANPATNDLTPAKDTTTGEIIPGIFLDTLGKLHGTPKPPISNELTQAVDENSKPIPGLFIDKAGRVHGRKQSLIDELTGGTGAQSTPTSAPTESKRFKFDKNGNPVK